MSQQTLLAHVKETHGPEIAAEVEHELSQRICDEDHSPVAVVAEVLARHQKPAGPPQVIDSVPAALKFNPTLRKLP